MAEAEILRPFKRCDVIDESFHVVLSGPSVLSLEPVPTRCLEPDVEAEVRALVRDRRLKRTTKSIGLVGFEYGLRLLERPGDAPGFYLISLEPIGLREPLESLAKRYDLTADELELARLLAGGYILSVIAFRTGTTLISAKKRIARLLEKVGAANRRSFVDRVLPTTRRGRPSRSLPAARRSG